MTVINTFAANSLIFRILGLLLVGIMANESQTVGTMALKYCTPVAPNSSYSTDIGFKRIGKNVIFCPA
jgi:hypothetical protein